ncbi:hypothetical protein [Paraburkholderia kururiensis]|uniref:hypothetical protein n=1 Tax=Paraburkholderia kururiensis TaxID=984307 RepID=UPI0039A61271
MLTSIVLGFIAARVTVDRSGIAPTLTPPYRTEGLDTFSVASEFLLWSLLVLTLSALVWMIAPAVAFAARFFSPAAGALFSVSAPPDCAPGSASWYVVKRALVGYAGLSFVALCIATAWRLAIALGIRPGRRAAGRWTVVIDDDEKT